MNLGNNTPGGFQSLQPTMQDLLKKVGMVGVNTGFSSEEAVPIEKSESAKEHEELLKCYVRFSNTDDGRKILEDLLNVTLRSGFLKEGAMQTIEQVALHASSRGGQNGIMIFIAKRIVDGLALGKKPAAKTRKRK